MIKRYTIKTNNLALAASLAAMGISFDNPPFTKTQGFNGRDQYTFYFEAESNCGKFKTTDLIKAWEDEKWHLKNPEHPFAYIKCAFDNREKLLDKVNQSASLVTIEKNGKLAIISSNASEAFQNKIFSQL